MDTFKTQEKRGFRGGSDERLFWLSFLPSIKGRLWFLPTVAITSIITFLDVNSPKIKIGVICIFSVHLWVFIKTNLLFVRIVHQNKSHWSTMHMSLNYLSVKNLEASGGQTIVLQSTTNVHTFLKRERALNTSLHSFGLCITISDINTSLIIRKKLTLPPVIFTHFIIVISLQKTIEDWWFGFCWSYIISSQFLWSTFYSGILKLILAWSVIKSFLSRKPTTF